MPPCRPPGQGKGESRSSVRRIEAKEKQAQALELRKTGMTMRAIAAEIGVSPQSVQSYIERAMKELVREPAEELVKLECERLDAMLLGIYEKAIHGGNWEIDRVLAIMERRAALLGLDAPKRTDFTSGGEAVKAYVGIDVEAV